MGLVNSPSANPKCIPPMGGKPGQSHPSPSSDWIRAQGNCAVLAGANVHAAMDAPTCAHGENCATVAAVVGRLAYHQRRRLATGFLLHEYSE